MDQMTFEDALALCEKASKGAAGLTFEEGLRVNAACAIVAMEYVRIKHRITPA